MAINGLFDFGGLYNNYRTVDIPRVDVETVKAQDEKKSMDEMAESQALSTPVYESTPVNDNRSRIANLDDISLNFNTGDDYSYIGSESSLGSLDMEKAISDMRKDKMLEDYQYFVGSQEVNNVNSDGMVFLK